MTPTLLEEVPADAGVHELDAGEVVGPAQLADVSLLVIDSGLALIRAEQPGTFREVVVCHAGAGSIVLPPRETEVLAALVPTRFRLLTPELRDRLLEDPDTAALLFDELAATVRSWPSSRF